MILPNIPSLYDVYFTRVANESPLDALRLLRLSPAQLEGLATILRALGETDLAGLVGAEADLRTMLERRWAACPTLN